MARSHQIPSSSSRTDLRASTRSRTAFEYSMGHFPPPNFKQYLYLEYERHRALQQALDLLQELRRRHAVEDPVVDRERDPHPLARHHLAVPDDCLVLDRTDREDA